MKQFVFRTNAKCSGCTAKIDAALSPLLTAGSWSFDLSSPDCTGIGPADRRSSPIGRLPRRAIKREIRPGHRSLSPPQGKSFPKKPLKKQNIQIHIPKRE